MSFESAFGAGLIGELGGLTAGSLCSLRGVPSAREFSRGCVRIVGHNGTKGLTEQ